MKSILISIKPQWCEKICNKIGKKNGKPIYEKPIEVREDAPSEVPFKAYIYATKPKRFYKCGAVHTSDELLWLANGKVEMSDGFKFWADGDEYQCLNGKVIGEFVCDKVDEYKFHEGLTEFNSMGLPSRIYGSYLIFTDDYKSMCLSYDEVKNYGKRKTLYGLHISDLKIYDKPKELSEFRKPFIDFVPPPESKMVNSKIGINEKVTNPPQSWFYVEELRK